MRKISASPVACALVLATALMLQAQDKEASETQTVTVTGTLVDAVCYAKGGFLTNDHGDMKNCGTMCATGGLPVAIVDGQKMVHFLGVSAPAYANYVGQELRLTGVHGKNADLLIPSKLEVKEGGKWVEKALPKTMM